MLVGRGFPARYPYLLSACPTSESPTTRPLMRISLRSGVIWHWAFSVTCGLGEDVCWAVEAADTLDTLTHGCPVVPVKVRSSRLDTRWRPGGMNGLTSDRHSPLGLCLGQPTPRLYDCVMEALRSRQQPPHRRGIPPLDSTLPRVSQQEPSARTGRTRCQPFPDAPRCQRERGRVHAEPAAGGFVLGRPGSVLFSSG